MTAVRPAAEREVADPAEPAAPADPLAAAGRGVEQLLGSRLHELARDWHGGSASADPVLASSDLPDLLRDLVLDGGKRLRPRFAHCGWAAAGGAGPHEPDDGSAVVRLGAALELLHAFGLVQDDVMDASATRRGLPAVHRRAQGLAAGLGGALPDATARYGESVAVLVGDLAHAEADALVATLPARVRARWRLACVELVRGQARDLSLAAHRVAEPTVDLDRAWEVARAKSGAYTVQRPLELGAALAGAGPEVLEPLTLAGRLVGEAFALRDDVLGVWGDPGTTGKPVGDDLRQAKPTVLVALAARRLTGEDRAALDRLAGPHHDESDVVRVTRAMEDGGVREEAEAMIRERRAEAAVVLDTPVLDPGGVAALLAVADAVVERAS